MVIGFCHHQRTVVLQVVWVQAVVGEIWVRAWEQLHQRGYDILCPGTVQHRRPRWMSRTLVQIPGRLPWQSRSVGRLACRMGVRSP